MKLREIMTRQVHMISASQSLQEAAQLMRDEDIGMLPVYNGGEITGILTDRDVVVNATAKGLNPTRAKVSEAMTKNVISCTEDTNIETAAKLLKDNLIRRLIVIDRDRRPVGVVSLGDIATRLDQSELSEEVLTQVSEDRQGLHH